MWCDVVSLGRLQQQGEYGFTLEQAGTQLEGFVLWWQATLYAYRNRCPHRGLPLEWRPHQFLDAGREFILCSAHGALFRPDDGLCVHGPCVKQHLQTLPVRLQGDKVQVRWD